MDERLTHKILGGMIGSALGDAIGELAFHYRTRDLLCAQIDLHEPLTYTDDTAMAIGLAESIRRTGKIDLKELGDGGGNTLTGMAFKRFLLLFSFACRSLIFFVSRSFLS